MGNGFEFTVLADNESFAMECIDKAIAEVQRIERLLTTFNEDSQVNKINDAAGIAPVKVDNEVLDIITRSIKISRITQGAFDITYGSVDKSLWNFDTRQTTLPDAATAKKYVRLINFEHIILDYENSTVFLKEKGMRIGFGGIGKGYAAERAKAILKSMGITSGIVNAAGDLTTWGYQPNGKQWTIGIADPDSKEGLYSYLNITDMAVATSGNYEKYILVNGKKYSHTIDPKTGLPVTGIKSTTIICANAEIADALATPVTVMGVKVGLDLINQMKGVSCIIVDDNNKIFTSRNINLIDQ